MIPGRPFGFLFLLALASAAGGRPPYSGHGAASVSPETVRKYVPPPLDPEVSRRIQTMLDLRSPGIGR